MILEYISIQKPTDLVSTSRSGNPDYGGERSQFFEEKLREFKYKRITRLKSAYDKLVRSHFMSQ